MSTRNKILWLLLTLSFFPGCKEPFEPVIDFDETNFLVVEGYINVGPGKTSIRLSRTSKVNEAVRQVFENGASLSIESENNDSYPLTFIGSGLYESAEITLPLGTAYRLRISIPEKSEFLSEYVQPKVTPPIDSVSWSYSETGLQIFANTHDPVGQTQYYQWDFEETWEIRSELTSMLKYENGVLSVRDLDESNAMSRCWKSGSPNELIFASTTQNENDIVKLQPLKFIQRHSERLSVRYSILVKQHALSADNYNYLYLMKKNTGPLGSFSDPQPSQLSGNIHSVDSNDPVVGYVGAYTTETKRIFIRNTDVENWNFTFSCEAFEVPVNPDSLNFYFKDSIYLPTVPGVGDLASGFITIWGAPIICVDCRRRDGSTIEPLFW